MSEQRNHEHVTVGDWIVFMILMTIPIANLVILVTEAFGSDKNPSKQNFCRAYLILSVLMVLGTIICIVAFGAMMIPLLEQIDFSNIDQMIQNNGTQVSPTMPK